MKRTHRLLLRLRSWQWMRRSLTLSPAKRFLSAWAKPGCPLAGLILVTESMRKLTGGYKSVAEGFQRACEVAGYQEHADQIKVELLRIGVHKQVLLAQSSERIGS